MGKLEIVEIAHHRNGVMGRPFWAVRFQMRHHNGMWVEMLGVVPSNSTPDECYVVCTTTLPTDGVQFGANSWRCEEFTDELRAAIQATLPEGEHV